MRRLAAALLGCLLLTACTSSSEHELRYKISGIDNTTSSAMYKLELVSDVPKDVLWQDRLTPQFKLSDNISGDVKVGDEVVCTATQKEGSPFSSWTKDTTLSGCKKA